MVNIGTEYQLYFNQNIVGVAILRAVKQPWLYCEFIKNELFEKYSELFKEELRISELGRSGYEEYLNFSTEYMDALDYYFTHDENKYIKPLIIHIDENNSALWFRY